MQRKEKCVLKRKQGTFSLSNQIVLDPSSNYIHKSVKVYGIHEKDGKRCGHLRVNNLTIPVEKLGVNGWAVVVKNEINLSSSVVKSFR